MEEKTPIHWRQGGKIEYCGVEILPNGKDIESIIIDQITYHDRLKVQGSEKDGVWTCHFTPNPYTKLPMLLNSTNRKRLSKQAKTPYLEKIKNFAVRLTQEETRDVQDGGLTMGLRISKIPAKQQPLASAPKEVLTKDHENWQKCVDYMKSGKPLKDLSKKYIISTQVEKELLACMI